MTYSQNVLPIDSAYYNLTNATLANGVLDVLPGGSVSIEINKTILSALTESVLIRLVPTSFTPSYEPKVYVRLDIIAAANNYSAVVSPTYDATGVVSATVALESGIYSRFILTIEAEDAIRFNSWELCPVATADIDVTTIIEGVEQSLPKLLSDFNVAKVNVEQEEKTVAIITCDLLANTDLQGHLLVEFDASEYCTVYVRFKDQEIQELFSPLQFTLNPGHNTITVPHAYMGKLAGIHTFIISMQTTNGTLTIYPRDMLFTIDGGYLAKRLIDMGIDMMDIAISQPNVLMGLSEIWAIGVDADEALVRSRDYNAESVSAAWTPRYAFEQAKAAAIEFDGIWVRDTLTGKWTIQTDAVPYVFIVNMLANLIVYRGGDILTGLTLDVDVKQVSVVRGYKSVLFPEQDQGIIAAYTKLDGSAWYRRYAYFEFSQTYVWYAPELLTEDYPVNNVHVHRLNDYRVGFALSLPYENLWLISERTYVAQTIDPEAYNTNIDDGYSAIAVLPANDASVLTGTVIGFETPGKQDLLSAQYTMDVVIRSSKATTKEHCKATLTDASGTRELEIHDITTKYNILSFYLAEAVNGIVTITFPPSIQLYKNGGYQLIADASYTWYVYNKITSNVEEAYSMQVTPMPDIAMRPLLDIQHTVGTDMYEINVETIPNIIMGEMNNLNNTIDTDTYATSASLLPVNITVILTGSKPI